MVGFPEGENISRTIPMSHSIESSSAFFKIPDLLFEYVTCLLLLLSNLLIFNLTLPILCNKEKKTAFSVISLLSSNFIYLFKLMAHFTEIKL